MAPPDVPAVEQTLPFPVRVVRWFKSPVAWAFIASQILTVGPIVLSMIGMLGLSPLNLLIWTIAVNLAVNNAGLYIHNQSTAVIGSKTDVAVSQADGNP